MLKWTVIFLVIAIVSAILGFGDILSENTADIAKFLFWVFIILFVLSILFKDGMDSPR